MRPTRILATLAILLVEASAAGAQQKAALSKPSAESAESFTRIGSIRELPSGKILVADPQDKIVQLVDLATGSMKKVGREGNGPGEYAFPGTLIPLPDGTTLLQDRLNRRFLTIGADGTPGDFLEMPRPPSNGASPTGPVLLGGITAVRGYDDRGRLYFSAPPFSPTGGTADSVALQRWDRVKPTFDTVGYLRIPAGSASQTQSGGTFRVVMGSNKRWTPTETWGVAGDGSVVRVIPEPYRVAWYDGRGRAVEGPAVPYTPAKVTEADKKEFIEQQSKSPPVTLRFTAGGPGGGGGGGGGTFQPPPPEFADTKPAFDGAAGNSVLVSPEAQVWVLRTRRAGDKIPTYDVFDRSGTLVKQVSLNPNSQVVGFGKGTVYVARTDDDDLQYLQRFPRP